MPKPLHDGHVSLWRDHLAVQFDGLPLWVLARMAYQRGQEEALLDEGKEALVRASKAFDTSFGATFKTFAVRVIRNQMWGAAKRLSRAVFIHQENVWTDPVGYEFRSTDLQEDHRTPSPDIALEYEDVLEKARLLPPRQWEALLMTVRDGLTYTAASGLLGVSRERVRQLRNQALERMRYLLRA